jgi:hypothetical protein
MGIAQATRFGTGEDLMGLLVAASELDIRLGALNNIAWGLLFVGDPANAVRLAEEAVSSKKQHEYASLHTLATAYAETGRPQEARRALAELSRLQGGAGPGSSDHYILGRIAEHYGALDAARSAYERVDKPSFSLGESTWELARRRLEALGTP